MNQALSDSIQNALDREANSFSLMDDVFVSIKNYIDTKVSASETSFNLSSSKIKGRESTSVVKKSISSMENRFKRLIFTPIYSRVMLPYFGSRIHELVDEPMGLVLKVKLKKYLYECFFNQNLELWDSDFDPLEIKVIDADAGLGTVDVSLEFKNGMEITYNV